jgi:pimeloyl-ACP methyl ester carboxylesterase
MYRSLPPGRPLGLLLALALLPWIAGPARAADKPQKVQFDTGDGVTIQGSFYPSPKGRDEPTVILLHKIGSDSHKDGWDSLAGKLADKGYSVLSFDFRGHGGSTAVEPKFWEKYPFNAGASRSGVRDPKTGKPRDTINQKEFTPGYYPYLVNDIAAAKMYLDDRNDAGECNSHSLILIGAEDGAALGALWMVAEWHRYTASVDLLGPRKVPLIRSVGDVPEGKDEYAALWLSMTPVLGGRLTLGQALRSALVYTGKDKKVPMGFLYGDKDENGQKHAEDYIRAIKGSDGSKLPFTEAASIKDTKLTGSALLRDSLDTESKILTYLTKIRDKNVPHKWTKADVDRTGFVWAFNPGRPAVAKEDKSKVLEPILPSWLGLSSP